MKTGLIIVCMMHVIAFSILIMGTGTRIEDSFESRVKSAITNKTWR